MKRKTLGRRALLSMVAAAICALSPRRKRCGAGAADLASSGHRRNTTRGPATLKSRSATRIPIRATPLSYAPSARRSMPIFLKKINEEGGINGRKITFITYDDGYSPPKTREMVRKLVEVDKVLFLFQTLGTPPNTMIWDYLNEQKVPQLFVATGASKWGDPKGHPWTMGFQPDYFTEAIIYANHILANVKDPKIAVLMQNDDYGKDYYNGFKQGLGTGADKIVKLATYEVADPMVDLQIIQLKDTGANVFFNIATPEVRGAGDKESRRDRLETRSLYQQCLDLNRYCHEASRFREQSRHHLSVLPERSYRPYLCQGQGFP